MQHNTDVCVRVCEIDVHGLEPNIQTNFQFSLSLPTCLTRLIIRFTTEGSGRSVSTPSQDAGWRRCILLLLISFITAGCAVFEWIQKESHLTVIQKRTFKSVTNQHILVVPSLTGWHDRLFREDHVTPQLLNTTLLGSALLGSTYWVEFLVKFDGWHIV